jgi:hypothetical protein
MDTDPSATLAAEVGAVLAAVVGPTLAAPDALGDDDVEHVLVVVGAALNHLARLDRRRHLPSIAIR